MSLTQRAVNNFPTRRNAAKWVLAVRYLRSKKLWVLDNGKAPNWGAKR